MNWQRLGQEALAEELEAGQPVDMETSRRFVEAGQVFAARLNRIAEEARAVETVK